MLIAARPATTTTTATASTTAGCLLCHLDFCFSIGVGGGCHHAEVGSVLPQGRGAADSQCCWAGWEKQGGNAWMLLLLLLLRLVRCESDAVTRADVQFAQQWCHFPQTHAGRRYC